MRRKINILNKFLLIVLCFSLFISLVACGDNSSSKDDSNEKVVVTMMYLQYMPKFEKLVEDKYPNIDLQIELNTMATLNAESERRLKNGRGTDLIMTSLPTGAVYDYTIDLSSNAFITRYSTAIMSQLKHGGEYHYVPLPQQYYGYIINKTLLDELGLAVPTKQSDYSTIFAKAVEEDKGVGPDGDCFAFANIWGSPIGSFAVSEMVPDFLGTKEGLKWSHDYVEGNETFTGAWDHALDLLMSYAQNDYVNPSRLTSVFYFGSLNAVDAQARLIDRSLIAAYETVANFNYINEHSEDEFIMLPHMSNSGGDSWLTSFSNGYLAINKSVDDKKLDACLKVLDLLSTVEGQNTWIEDTDCNYSCLNEFEFDYHLLPAGIKTVAEQGYLYESSISEMVTQYFGMQAILAMQGKQTVKDALKAVDTFVENGEIDDSLEGGNEVVGKLASDLIYAEYNTRKEETAIGNMVTDAIKEELGAQIVLLNGGAFGTSLYAGDVQVYDIKRALPYSDTNKLVIIEVTGKQIKEALTNAISKMIRVDDDGKPKAPHGRFMQTSGLKYSFVPMKDANDTGKLMSVRLADGSPIYDDKTYTVVTTDYIAGAKGYANGTGDGFTMFNAYGEDACCTLISEDNPTMVDCVINYFKKHNGTVSAQIEGRITVLSE